MIRIGRVREGKVEIQQGEAWSPADDVIILGAGAGDSDGFVLVGQSVTHYITNTQVDAAYMLDKLINLCDKIAAQGNALFAVPSVGTAVNATMQEIGQAAASMASEMREYKLK